MFLEHRLNDDESLRYVLTTQLIEHSLTVASTYLQPHQSTRGHSHPNPENYFFHSDCILKLDDEEIEIKAPQHIHIQPNVFHQVFNPSDNIVAFTCTY